MSDNGTQFCSQEFQNFLRSNGITHKRTAPFHPATNGQAERFVQILKKSILRFEGNDLEINLQRLLLHYRISPHCSTKLSPSELLFGRKIISRLDFLIPGEETSVSNANSDKKFSSLSVNDRVQCRNYVGHEK